MAETQYRARAVKRSALHPSAVSPSRDVPAVSFVVQKPQKLPSGPPSFRPHRSLDIAFGIQPGDIADVRDVDVWVNPENTDMEMARFHDPTISGVIRFLGARWTKGFGDSDDAVFRSLLEEVSRAWGVDRPVPAASVFLGRAGRLEQTNGVKRIAHVAAVEPVDRARPGTNYRLVDRPKDCVTNVLAAIDAFNRGFGALRPKLTSVLFPLMGAGTADASPRGASEIIVRAAATYVFANPDTSLRRVLFLAYTKADLKLFEDALAEANGFSAA